MKSKFILIPAFSSISGCFFDPTKSIDPPPNLGQRENRLRIINWVPMIVGIAMCQAFTCTVNFEYLMAPKRAVDRSHINSMKTSYSIPMLESTCNEIIRLISKREDRVEATGCLNGLGHLAVIQLGWVKNKHFHVDEIALGCDGFKTGSFIVGKKNYQIPFSDKIRSELNNIQIEIDSFNRRAIDSTYF